MSKRYLHALAYGFTLAACGAQPSPQSEWASPSQVVLSPPPPKPSPAKAEPPSSNPAPSPPPPPEPLPPAVELGAPMACTLLSPDFRPDAYIVQLHLKPHALPYLQVIGGQAEILFPTGKPSTLLMHKKSGGLLLRGHIEPSVVQLYPSRAIIMNEFVIPQAWAKLGWLEALPGEFILTLPTPPEISIADSAPLKYKGPCADASLDRGRIDDSYKARESLPGLKGKPTKTMFLRAGRSIPLWTEPKPAAPPVAHLKVGNTEPYVNILESKPGWSRISWEIEDLVVFGWLKSSDLEPSKPGKGYGSGSGRPTLRVPKWPLVARLACEKDIPVMAEVEKTRALVGSIERGTPIEVIEQMDGVSRIWVRVPHVFPTQTVSPLLALQSDLKDCKDAPEASAPKIK